MTVYHPRPWFHSFLYLPESPSTNKPSTPPDGALELKSVPEWVAIIGSGYIGLEFSDVYTALGSEVDFSLRHCQTLCPRLIEKIAKQAERLLIRERPIDYRTGVFC